MTAQRIPAMRAQKMTARTAYKDVVPSRRQDQAKD